MDIALLHAIKSIGSHDADIIITLFIHDSNNNLC